MSAWLLDKCIAYAKAHRHPELTEQTIWECQLAWSSYSDRDWQPVQNNAFTGGTTGNATAGVSWSALDVATNTSAQIRSRLENSRVLSMSPKTPSPFEFKCPHGVALYQMEFGRTARETTTRPFAVSAAMSWRSGMARRCTIGGKGGPETLLNSQRISQRSPAKRLSAGGRAFESVGLFARINRGNVLSLSDLLGCVNSRQEGKVANGF